MATKKVMYMDARKVGKTNAQIAGEFGVLENTVNKAIGKTPENLNKKGTKHVDFDDDTFVESIIQPANKVLKTEVVNCCDCKRTFSITPAEQKFYIAKEYNLPKRCEKCRKKRSQADDHICVDCGITFKVRLTEKEFFEKNGLHVPQRCCQCRSIKRERNEAQAKENNI